MIDQRAHHILQEILVAHDVPRALLQEPQSLSWLLGARWNIRHSMHDPLFSAVVHAGSDHVDVLAPRNEAARLLETEFALDPRIRMQICEWWEDKLDAVSGDASLASDRAGDGRLDLSSPIRDARLILTGSHQQTLRSLTADVADVVEEVAAELTKSMTEFEVSGLVHARLLSRGIDPLLVLVGAGDRLQTHKHPIPTQTAVHGLTMISVGARRNGLVTSVTRYIHFGAIPADAARDYAALLEVEARFLDHSMAGRSLEAVFNHGCAAYAEAGLESGAWHEHHQGGLAGFAPREIVAGKGVDITLSAGHVVAWNPSARGLKVEDVAIVGGQGCEPLFTDRGHWPTTTVHGRIRPLILER